jgi:hypothetical protein
MYRPKWEMPQHPREARCDKAGERKILLWRNATALVLVAEPVAAPITARAIEIVAERGTQSVHAEHCPDIATK